MVRTSKSKSQAALGKVVYGFFLVGALGVGSLYGWARRSPMLSRVLTDPLAVWREDPKQAFDNKDVETLLILGCDEDRFYRGVKLHGQNIYKKFARSDMMLVTRMDFAHNQITGLSIPRDTLVTLPGWKAHKINAFHELAKPAEADAVTQQAVETILPQVHIDKVVDIDFEEMQKLVDMVGGVELNVPKAMNYDDNAGELHIHLKPGEQKLGGYDAMGFVRFRHDQESDFGRQQRQKDFLLAFKQAAFKDLLALPELANQGKVALNKALDDKELEALAVFAKRVPPANIRMGMVPVMNGEGTTLVVDKKLLPKRLAEYGFTPDGVTPADGSSSPASGAN